MFRYYSQFVDSVLGPFSPVLQATGIPLYRLSKGCLTFLISLQSEVYLLTEIIMTYDRDFFMMNLSADSSGIEKLNFFMYSVAEFTLGTFIHFVLIRTFAETLTTCWNRLERIHIKAGYPDLSTRRRMSVSAFLYVIFMVLNVAYGLKQLIAKVIHCNIIAGCNESCVVYLF